MSSESSELSPLQLAGELSQATSVEEALERIRGLLWGQASPDILALHSPQRTIALSQTTYQALPIEYNSKDFATLQDVKLESSVFLADVALDPSPVAASVQLRGVRSLALVPIGKHKPLIFEVTFYNRYHRFRDEEMRLIETAAVILAGALTPPAQEESQNVVPDTTTNARVLALSFDRDFHLAQVLGPVERLLGVTQENLLRNAQWWRTLVHPSDLKRLIGRTSQAPYREITEEIRVFKHGDNTALWFLLNIAPRFDNENRLLGWEGFALDVSEKYIAKVELLSERRRLEALYEVSRALEQGSDPAVVALNGLQALMRATLSDGGVVFLLEEPAQELEIVAAHGLTQGQLSQLRNLRLDSGLIGDVAESRKSIHFNNLQNRGKVEAAVLELFLAKSAIITPLLFEDSLLGIVLLYGKRHNRYTQADVDVVEATANQLALAARQAELYLAERTQAESLAALYRLSHELSKQVSLPDVINTSFPIIREELATKRLWVGILNEQKTLLVGESGEGPGMRKAISHMRVDLTVAPEILKKVLEDRKVTVIPNARAQACAELDKLFQRLGVGTLALVPLISLGQMIGILVVEPQVSTGFFSEHRLKLVQGMANELATIILARRYESQMADTAKMQMASLLASGVAHNFNNLLQVIMGQASLIQLQAGETSKIGNVAQGILDSATKGADLVRQLYTFSSADSFNPQSLSLKQALLDWQTLFKDTIGTDTKLTYDLPDTLEASVDLHMLRQMLVNMLNNANEALKTSHLKQITIHGEEVTLAAGEINPELEAGTYVRIDIEDSGKGMDEEEQKRCFEPFFSTKNRDPRSGLSLTGGGLGLSAAYLIMKQHKGLITVRSVVDIGTTFSLYFPKNTPAKPALANSTEAKLGKTGG